MGVEARAEVRDGGEGWGCEGCEGWGRKTGGVCAVGGGGELGGGGDGSGDARWPVWRGEVAAAGRRGCERGGPARWRVRGGGIARWQVRLGGRIDCELAGAGLGLVGCRGGVGDCWEAAGMGRMAGAAASGCGRGEERRMGAGAVAGGEAAAAGRRAGSEGKAGAGGKRRIPTMSRTPDAL